MTKPRAIQISALNIAMHAPHSPSRYVEMLLDAYRLQMKVRLGSVFCAMMGALYQPPQADALAGISGELYRFLKIDPDEPWFNAATNAVASDAELQAINIPQHLLPHLRRIPFVFRPKSHRLYFVSKDKANALGTPSAKKLFEVLLGQLTLKHGYPPIEVTVLPDQESIERIFSMPGLDMLGIELTRPNPDDGLDDEVRLLNKLANQHAKRMRVVYLAEPNATIVPDADTRALAQVASHNGRVWAKGRNAQGLRIEESTTERPLTHAAFVDSQVETTNQVLDRAAEELDKR